MSANFRFIVHPAKRDAHELAAHGPSDRFPQRSFAHARRSDEAKDGSLHTWLKFLDRQIIQNAFLHLLEVVVILVQNGVRFLDVDLFRLRAGRF